VAAVFCPKNLAFARLRGLQPPSYPGSCVYGTVCIVWQCKHRGLADSFTVVLIVDFVVVVILVYSITDEQTDYKRVAVVYSAVYV